MPSEPVSPLAVYVDNHIQHPQEFTKARHLANVAKNLVHKILITPRLVPGGTH